MKMNRKWMAAAGMAALFGALTACGQGESGGESSRQVTVFEDFTAQDLDGNPVDESIFADCDVTMINLWGTFCGPCLQEMPDLGEISDEYADKGFQIVGICTDAVNLDGEILEDVVETAKADAQETGADYLHIVPVGEIFTDLLPRVTGVPTTIFVDSKGQQIGLADIGAKDKDAWIQVIEEKLAQAGQEEG
ncbi:MAG TPA: TlpA family protein disulfide reductase [Candidatus Lachnoclostridium stercoripullorum]|uniref:TlpA family protein disulfide reductase n=1 Tax=Candidatus Lachnoclostridium stercoripullorum TaxID=2838635 RepID=A0A9D1W4T3_9FIRM|nr:TlpA family protein disulfide reductase [Candidatus Lachnoclostridium stercoripullorum]